MFTKKQSSRTLFFIDGPVPDTKEREAIEAISGPVALRNAQEIKADDKPEQCSAVAGKLDGNVAIVYAAKLPKAPEAPKPAAPAGKK